MANTAETLLKKLRKLEGNMNCPNCGTRASVGIGFGSVCVKYKTFVCDLCKTSHQAISHRVKSTSMSSWTMDEVKELMDENGGGNMAARHNWLANAPAQGGRYPGGTRPKPGDQVEVFKKFVVDCYESGKFRSSVPYEPGSNPTPTSTPSTPSTPRSPNVSTKATPTNSLSSKSDTSSSSLKLQVPTPQVNLIDSDLFDTSPTTTNASIGPTTPTSTFNPDFSFTSSPVKPTTDPFSVPPSFDSANFQASNFDTVFEFSSSTNSNSFGFSDSGGVTSFSANTLNNANASSRSRVSQNNTPTSTPDLLDIFSGPTTSTPISNPSFNFETLAPQTSITSSSGFDFLSTSTPSTPSGATLFPPAPQPIMLNNASSAIGGLGIGGGPMRSMGGGMGIGGGIGMNNGMGMGGGMGMGMGMGMGRGQNNGMGGGGINGLGGMNSGMGMGMGMSSNGGFNSGNGMGMNSGVGGGMNNPGGMNSGMGMGMGMGMGSLGSISSSNSTRRGSNALSISSLDPNFNSGGIRGTPSTSGKQSSDAFDFVNLSMKSNR